MGLFHRIKEMEVWSGGHLVQLPIQNGPAIFQVILLNPWYNGMSKDSSSQFRVNIEVFSLFFFSGKLLSWA